MKSALIGRTDSKLVVAGRTGSFHISETADAGMWVKEYQKAGVDSMFFTGQTTCEQLEAVSDREYLASMGVRSPYRSISHIWQAYKLCTTPLKNSGRGTHQENWVVKEDTTDS